MAQQPKEVAAEEQVETKVESGSTELNPVTKPAKAKETVKLGNGTVQENY
jgi:hypothetical protein